MKPKILVIYKSSTGFTKRYAEWLSQEVNCKLAPYQSASPELMSGYETVVFGTRAHAGRVDGYKKIKEMYKKSSARKFALFATGAMPASAESTIAEFWAQNLSGNELQKIPHFYLPGGLCYEKMPAGDKLMMKAAVAMVKKKKNKTAEDLEMERAMASSYDISDKAYLKPLVSLLKKAEG